ncbi:MAG: glycosyltransferase family 2 protein [Planctomycetes bacterium]|nr:glycosyltransferase family 2 protein [Planctomycetota bacterium]
MPKVSVIIPTYNSNGLVKETICSVMAQSERDLEVLVVDDGSTDDTRSVVESLNDRRITYFYKTNGGPASARNFGLSKAKGEYVAFLDHDDLWPVNYLAVMLSGLEKHTEFGLAYSPITVRYPDGREIKSFKAPKVKSGWLVVELFKQGFIWTSAVLIRRAVLKNFCYDELLRTSYEDSDFFLRLAMRTQFLFVPEVEAIRSEHTKNLSSEAGVLPTRIIILERFYFRSGGDKVVPVKIAKRKLSHATRRVAETYRHKACRTAAITLYKHAINYHPVDLRLYFGLSRALLLSKRNDKMPAWRMPEPLADVAG